MKIIYEFFSCEDCPYCKKGKTYGNDGRDGDTVFVCGKGAFGYFEGYYAKGKNYGDVRSGIDKNCPLESLK